MSVASTAKYFVPRLPGSFCAAFPEIDVALEVPPGDLERERHAFLANPLDLIASASHPLAGRQRISLDELAPMRFILREKGPGTRLACDRHNWWTLYRKGKKLSPVALAFLLHLEHAK